MRVTFSPIGSDLESPATPPHAEADHVVVEGLACPACKAAPLKVRGRGTDIHEHDYESAPAFCLCCGVDVGRIIVTYSTIFGIEEDRAVLNGRARVY